jgi:two-component system chemotaxis sensor kinase CheA
MEHNNRFIETFREESFELLGTLENDLLELEKNPNDSELVASVFRVMHTIKGSAAMFGFDVISAFAHRTETVMSDVRDGKLPFTSDIASKVLNARDVLLDMLGDPEHAIAPANGEEPLQETHDESVKPVKDTDSGQIETWHIFFKPSESVLGRGFNPFKLVSELTMLGEAVCVPEFTGIPAIENIKSEQLADGWNVFLTTDIGENAIRDVFIFVEGDCELKISCLSRSVDAESGEVKKLGEILIEQGKIDEATLTRILGTKKRLGDTLIEQKLVSPTSIKAALEEQKQLQKVQSDHKVKNELSTLRVKSEKLDALMALVSELVTIHAQIRETAGRVENSGSDAGSDHATSVSELSLIVEQFGRLTDSLRDTTMEIRMVPVGTNFSMFRRLVRDLSAELGKKIDFVTTGEATELDKSVIEKLHDPLVHIIRNSLDHGIETPEIRASRGKSETGTITLSAVQAGTNVQISIEDDGNGLDRVAILEKAISKGLVKQGDQLEDQEIYKLIFLPGFSTKKLVTSVSGRGVGMDVVNRQMEEIGGRISIESTEKKGTRITLAIPLTLAIIEGLLVRCGTEHFVIPLSSVTGCLEFTQESRRAGTDTVEYRDHLLPYVDLGECFGIAGVREEMRQIVIVALRDKPYGLLVDRIEGMDQTVIKPLDGIYRNARGISGATIRGNGSIALILDIEQIILDSCG